MKIIVYGYGKNGKEFVEDISAVQEPEIEITAVTDSSIETAYESGGIPFINPLSIPKYEFDYIVITPEKYFCEIQEFLERCGIEMEKIKSIQEFHKSEGQLYCEVCKSKILIWRRYFGYEFQARGECPICTAFHRHRFVYYVIKKYTNMLDGKNHDVLHFAPEVCFEEFRESCGPGYITADIVPGRADVTADITDLPFSDNQFEYIICNHVMEHVTRDEKGFSEMRRVLKSGKGGLILSVPIHWNDVTLEDENIKTKEDIIKYYGQEDHVRFYGKDIVEKVERLGFDVKVFFCDELINEEQMVKLGYPRSRYEDGEGLVFLCQKRLVEND